MNNGKFSSKLCGKKYKVVCFGIVVISGPLVLWMRYLENGTLDTLDFVGVGSAVVMGAMVFTLIGWYANRK